MSIAADSLGKHLQTQLDQSPAESKRYQIVIAYASIGLSSVAMIAGLALMVISALGSVFTAGSSILIFATGAALFFAGGGGVGASAYWLDYRYTAEEEADEQRIENAFRALEHNRVNNV